MNSARGSSAPKPARPPGDDPRSGRPIPSLMASSTPALSSARTMILAILRWLGDRLLGPRCEVCGERQPGPRTMARHLLSRHQVGA